MLYSDHRAIKCKLRVMCRLKRKTDPRQKLIHFDHSKLSNNHVSSAFCEEVASNLNPTDVNYSNLASAVAKAATSVFPKSERAKPGSKQMRLK